MFSSSARLDARRLTRDNKNASSGRDQSQTCRAFRPWGVSFRLAAGPWRLAPQHRTWTNRHMSFPTVNPDNRHAPATRRPPLRHSFFLPWPPGGACALGQSKTASSKAASAVAGRGFLPGELPLEREPSLRWGMGRQRAAAEAHLRGTSRGKGSGILVRLKQPPRPAPHVSSAQATLMAGTCVHTASRASSRRPYLRLPPDHVQVPSKHVSVAGMGACTRSRSDVLLPSSRMEAGGQASKTCSRKYPAPRAVEVVQHGACTTAVGIRCPGGR